MRFTTTFWGMLIASTSIALADSPPNITQIYENYIASAVAAERCPAKNPSTENNFHQNLMIVTIRAFQSVKEKTNLPDEKVGVIFASSTKSIEQQVATFVDKNGCSSDAVANILKMHKVHSTMDLMAAARPKN